MKLTYDPNLYELENGLCIAQFNRVDEFVADPKTSPQAAKFGPSLKWEFICCDGPNRGKPTSVLTSQRPTPKNSCLRMLSALAGRPMAENEEIDTNKFLNRYYRIVVIDGRMSIQHPPTYLGTTLEQAKKTFESMTPPDVAADSDGDNVPF